MTDDITRDVPSPDTPGSFAERPRATSRRGFLRALGLGGTIAALPRLVVACGSDSVTEPSNGIPGTGEPLLIDFASGDLAILQLASVIEQIEAEFYARVVAAFATSNITASEQTVFTEIRSQPEFNQQLWQYINRRVSDWRVQAGQDRLKEFGSLLARIEKDFGV